MKRKAKSILTVVCLAVIIVCMALGFTACNLIDNILNRFNSAKLNGMADSIAISLLGNDAYTWNVFAVDPSGSFGYVKGGDYCWYEYNPTSSDDIAVAYDAFDSLYDELKKINVSRLQAKDAATYRSLDNALYTYTSYYGSPYAEDFTLIGASYLNSQGGYVADFADCVGNYSFRTESDVQNLLDIATSVKDAFLTYIDYAEDRDDAGYPLFDSTLNAMQDYLNEIVEQGDEYYLYELITNKINAAEFLTSTKKAGYIASFKVAIKDSFIEGARLLCEGLEQFKGKVTDPGRTYLSAYGEVGKAYYTWRFQQITGMKNVNMQTVYNELSGCVDSLYLMNEAVMEQVEIWKTEEPAAYEDFQAYLDGEKAILDLKTPDEIMDYLKAASKKIVPNLKTMPVIDFKYMDSTVAKRTNTMAYYLKSPIDDRNSSEHITLNQNFLNDDYALLLTTMAHEGYPGHLYAHVNAKENDLSFLTHVNSCLAFSEGWAVYASVALLQEIMASSQDPATKLFCYYYANYMVISYANMAANDIIFNYKGYTVQDCVDEGIFEEDDANTLIEMLTEEPAVYIPYGYGAYYMVDLHGKISMQMGDRYSAVELNRLLLSEGFSITLDRASAIAQEYSKKA